MPTVADKNITVTLKGISCANCGVVYGLAAGYEKERREDHQTFFCPNGHAQHFPAKSEAEKLRDQLARERHDRDQNEARLRGCINDERVKRTTVERRLRGTKAVVTRMKRKLVAGRCPCCSHQFKDLERHMSNRHPNWNPDRAAEALAEK